jgi:hypothetical protein
MNAFCIECGYRYVREPGFFLGAMYVSYALAGILLGLFTLLLSVFVVPDWPLYWVLGPAFLLLLPFAPLIFRYSRTLWFYFEQWVDPRP